MAAAGSGAGVHQIRRSRKTWKHLLGKGYTFSKKDRNQKQRTKTKKKAKRVEKHPEKLASG